MKKNKKKDLILGSIIILASTFILVGAGKVKESKEAVEVSSSTQIISQLTSETVATTTTIPTTKNETTTEEIILTQSTTKKQITTTKPQTTKSETTEATTRSYYDEEEKEFYILHASVTAYCSCRSCSGGYGASTASGATPVPKYTIAMDKKYPFGTKVYIPGIGMCEVQDRGGAVRGNVIDVYFSSHEEAMEWGRRSLDVKVYR